MNSTSPGHSAGDLVSICKIIINVDIASQGFFFWGTGVGAEYFFVLFLHQVMNSARFDESWLNHPAWPWYIGQRWEPRSTRACDAWPSILFGRN
jgi:hypothetical protein